jgi:hypothetical protein
MLATATLLAAMGSAVAATGDPALQARNPRLAIQWSGEQTRTPPFDKVFLAPVELDFRPVAPPTGLGRVSADDIGYPVPERDREELESAFTEIFREQLGKNKNYALADEPGPGVLVVKPALRDIVSRVPPEEPPGSSAIFLDSVADATLVLDLVDPATDRTLGTAIDRRTAEPAGTSGGFGAVRATKPMTSQEIRRLLRRWALTTDRRLQQLYFEAKPR